MLEAITEFFKWCTIINVGLFICSAGLCIGAKKMIYNVHGKMFSLDPETLNVVLYSFIAFHKIVVITFFLVPWLALQIIQ